MITEHDIITIKNAVLKNVPSDEIATAIAMMNVGLHFLGLFERFVVAVETIANDGKITTKPPA